MSYYERIRELTKNVPVSLVDFSLPRDLARTPTQASSNFITNKEQGDWAESLVKRAINETSKNFVAIKYGKSDDLIAGDEGFDNFYQEFQNELDTIGKRPDLLIFKKSDFDDQLGYDISRVPHHTIADYVRKAVAEIEVRSSAFLIDRYEASMRIRTERFAEKALQLKDKILSEYKDILDNPTRKKYIPVLEGITAETLSVTDFKVPGWSSSERLVELNNLFKELKRSITEIQKRDFLCITPKVEDIKVVYKWIETFNVPHFYFKFSLIRFMEFPLNKFCKLFPTPTKRALCFP
jgi:type II restriction enzyme